MGANNAFKMTHEFKAYLWASFAVGILLMGTVACWITWDRDARWERKIVTFEKSNARLADALVDAQADRDRLREENDRFRSGMLPGAAR